MNDDGLCARNLEEEIANASTGKTTGLHHNTTLPKTMPVPADLKGALANVRASPRENLQLDWEPKGKDFLNSSAPRRPGHQAPPPLPYPPELGGRRADLWGSRG